MKSRMSVFLEAVVTIAIVLVIVHTFIEELAVLSRWELGVRRPLAFAGFFFDLFFTLEFLVRLSNAILERRFSHYFLEQRGWIDFMASIPLLIFSSGPVALAFLTEGTALFGIGGILNMLKVIKSIRIARILRFLRVLKVFKKIKHADSRMAQRHVATITTIGVTVLVFSLLVFSVIVGAFGIPGLDTQIVIEQQALVESLSEKTDDPRELTTAIADIADIETTLLIVKVDDHTVFSRYANGYYERFFGPADYAHYRQGELTAYFDMRPQTRQSARENILFFCIVVLMVFAYMLFYSPHFAITITDPIHVMKRGMEETDYNLEVRIPKRFQEDDVFELAQLYNEVFLPLKDRTASKEQSPTVEMDLDDLKDIIG